ncbi:MAG: xanthine dehydrogenase family protein subunit M [Anaerolineales bacterium]|nr:xanthine dehydrogenase family protein subunit M [Anaerolineales bacterium]
MNLWQQYVRPTSVAEAVTALTSAPGPALPLAGGTDILLDLQQGRHSPVHTIVDLTEIPDLKRLEIRDERLFIGAGVPLSRIARDPLVASHAQALVEACDLVGGPQVRNVATLGGNVAHALPAADGTIGLMCLDAEAEIAGPGGNRRNLMPELFLGPGKSALQSGEIIVGFYVDQTKPGQASCFKRIMRPQGVALPIINNSVWLEREGETIRQIRIAVGPGGAVPFRARKAEAFLADKPYSDETFKSALEALVGEVKFRTSAMRATSEYRYHLAGTLLKDTLETAWRRAG